MLGARTAAATSSERDDTLLAVLQADGLRNLLSLPGRATMIPARAEVALYETRAGGAADDSVDAELARLARIDRAVAEAHQHDLGCRGATLEGGTDLQSAAPRQEEVHQHEIGPAPRPDEKEHAYDGSDGYREIP